MPNPDAPETAETVMTSNLAEQGAAYPRAGALVLLQALKDARFAVVPIPTVAHKGPNDTDASMLLRAAQNLEDGYHIGGGNVQAAIIRLLRATAAEVPGA